MIKQELPQGESRFLRGKAGKISKTLTTLISLEQNLSFNQEKIK
jgi:hypothetical protein